MGIVFNNVSFNYDKKLFSNVNLTIKSNSICGIIGKSGSGKTTFLELIAGLLNPNEGEILFENSKILRKEIGIISQISDHSMFSKNVYDEISFALFNFEMDKKRIFDVLKMLNLNEDILSKKIKELSKGEKRLVSIASILVYNPKIILFDEPTIGLDNKNKKIIINLIKNLKIRFNKTILIVSHDIDLLYELCDDLLVISNGNIVLHDNPISVFKEKELLSKIGLNIPKVVLFEDLALKKNIKLLNSKNVNDLIKEVYRNV